VTDPESDPPLDDYLAPGVQPSDLPALFLLNRARPTLRAFTTLFHGGEGSVLTRLLVLREMGARGQAPAWTLAELRRAFAYLDPGKLETVLSRLRDNGLLLWETEDQSYRISPVGRKALAALSALLQFGEDVGDDLGYITAQLAAGRALGLVSGEELQHLLARLNELKDSFDRAVLSGSEFRIRRAAETLGSVWGWVEKGTEVVRAIAQNPDLDPPTHRIAQQVGRAQSSLLHMAGTFQRALNQLDRHRVHLGQTGLSSSDLNNWLRALDVPQIARLLTATGSPSLHPGFVLGEIALDIAEYELVVRARAAPEDLSLPAAQAAPEADRIEQEDDLQLLAEWAEELARLAQPTSLAEAVPAIDYRSSAYRFSLLALLGDPQSATLDGAMADFARLPVVCEIAAIQAPVDRDGVETISEGRLMPLAPQVSPVTG
jgi:hypothetical protein